jgi:hypothetical protein
MQPPAELPDGDFDVHTLSLLGRRHLAFLIRMGPEVLEVRIAAEIFQQVVLVDAVIFRLLPASPSFGGYGLAASVICLLSSVFCHLTPLPPRVLFSGLYHQVVVFFL